MGSITSWIRLEPRGRDDDMTDAVHARVYDPLWMLARQWQMGEFQGEDTGTPVLARWRATEHADHALFRRSDQAEHPAQRAALRRSLDAARSAGRAPAAAQTDERRLAATGGRVRAALPAHDRGAAHVAQLPPRFPVTLRSAAADGCGTRRPRRRDALVLEADGGARARCAQDRGDIPRCQW